MDGPRGCHSDLSPTVKDKGTNELIYRREVESWMQKTNLWLPEDKGGRDKLGDWDSHIHMAVYKIDNNSTQYSVMAYMGKES